MHHRLGLFRCLHLIGMILAVLGLNANADPNPPDDSSVWDRFSLSNTPDDIDRLTADTDDRKPLRVRLVWNNDGTFINPFSTSDAQYSNGILIDTAYRPAWFQELTPRLPYADAFDPTGGERTRSAVGAFFGHQIYTPVNLLSLTPIPNDRPYAGLLFGGVFFQRDNAGRPASPNALPSHQRATQPSEGLLDDLAQLPSFEHLEIQLGLMGPGAQAEPIQDQVHTTFSGDDPNGWENQNNDEPILQINARKAWRIDGPTLTVFDLPLQTQFLPQVSGRLGTTFIDGGMDITGRLGFNLPDDFGPGTSFVIPSATGLGQTAPDRTLSVAIFGRAGAKAVAHNALLEDSFFHNNTVQVDLEPIVGQVEFGLTAGYRRPTWHVELVWSFIRNSDEFKTQRITDDRGNLNLSFGWLF